MFPLAPDPVLLAIAVCADFAFGDPVYSLHPVRLIGRSLSGIESFLRRIRLDGYGGGIVLFISLATIWVGGVSGALLWIVRVNALLAAALHLFLAYSLLAMGDLLHHGREVEAALCRADLPAARLAISKLVGRDTDRMDAAACRRASLESLSESLTDGFMSALFWYALVGLPGLVLFKVVSTMDSMVGYKTPRYLRFGWCGARLDDLMNFVPARLTWLLIVLVAAVLPRSSAKKALRIGWSQHALCPGPNSGWSEAALAGAIERRLAGPIWLRGNLVTDIWLGEPRDPPASEHSDYSHGVTVVVVTGILSAVLACIFIWARS